MLPPALMEMLRGDEMEISLLEVIAISCSDVACFSLDRLRAARGRRRWTPRGRAFRKAIAARFRADFAAYRAGEALACVRLVRERLRLSEPLSAGPVRHRTLYFVRIALDRIAAAQDLEALLVLAVRRHYVARRLRQRCRHVQADTTKRYAREASHLISSLSINSKRFP